MILKSFYRKKSTCVYLVIITLLFLVLSAMLIINRYLEEIKNNYYLDSNLVLIESSVDYKNLLENYNDIINIERCILFSYTDDLIKQSYINDLNINNKVIVYSDADLENDEIILGLMSYYYEFIKSNIDGILNESIKVNFEGEELNLNLVDVIDNKRKSNIYIAKKLFEELAVNNYFYTFNIMTENKEKEVRKYLNENIDGEVHYLKYELADDYVFNEKINNYIAISKVLTLVLCGGLLLILIIINKNIIADVDKNIMLEYKLGVRPIDIKKNVMKMLISLHGISFMISIIVVLIICNINISKNYILMMILIFGVILIVDLLMSLVINLNRILRKNK